ncbi:MAG: TA system VapC family ribonuclease toxin [Egibacteraceae bacterium]
MKLVDTNLLLYAVDDTSVHHAVVRPWLETKLSGTETIGFAWNAMLGFVRLSTSAHVFSVPLTVDRALDLLEAWLAQPCAAVLQPTKRHTAVLRDLLAPLGTAGNLTSDAHLAALALEHGAQICSTDGDFARFRGVELVNPLRS